jgi:hypothetical protein
MDKPVRVRARPGVVVIESKMVPLLAGTKSRAKLPRGMVEPASGRFTARTILFAAVCLAAGALLGWFLARS